MKTCPIHRMTHRPPGPRKAFTLIELLVVIAILAVVAGGVIAVYDDAHRRAEEGMAQRQLATLRDALLRFRVDMGYFPGEGPLAVEHLDLRGFHHIGRGNDENARVRWAAHPMNFWMLYERPVDRLNPNRWLWNPASARGWRGPYLGEGSDLSLDGAGTLETGFTAGGRLDRLYAVTDLIGRVRPGDDKTPLRWVREDRTPTAPGVPEKTAQTGAGRPIAFLVDPASAPGWIVYRLVSAGPDGVFQTRNAIPSGDDFSVEITRRERR